MMPVSFNHIPSGNNLRVPLFYAEMDNSQANYASGTAAPALLIGQMLGTGTAAAGTPVVVSGSNDANALFGRGSMLARMVNLYRQSDPLGELWCIPVADNSAGVAATGTITVSGAATAAGTINLYIAGQLVQVAVGSADSANTIATHIGAVINAALDLPVTATVSSAVVTVACRWKGLTGNDIGLQDSYRGSAGGEALPTGVSLAYVVMSGGTTNPSLAPAVTGMGANPYDFIIHPYTDSGSLSTISAAMNDAAGRWSWLEQIYGHVYTALRGSLSNLVTFGALVNDQHLTVAAIDADCQAPCWEYAASYGAANAVFIKADPARPTQTGQLNGIMVPRAGKQFIQSDRNTLLAWGVATSSVVAGVVQVERAITTYQLDQYGQPDTSYMDSETMHTAAYVLRDLRRLIVSKYGRHKLADDGTLYGPGQAIVTPAVIRGELIGEYNVLERNGFVQNATAFAQYLILERDANNPNRVNALFPPEYINQLRVFAVLNQFRLSDPPPVSNTIY